MLIYLRRTAADGSDFVGERSHGDEQRVVFVQDSTARRGVQPKQAFAAQQIQREAYVKNVRDTRNTDRKQTNTTKRGYRKGGREKYKFRQSLRSHLFLDIGISFIT